MKARYGKAAGLAALCMVALMGCGKAPEAPLPTVAAEATPERPGLNLSTESAARLQIEAAVLQSVEYSAVTSGIGTVIDPQPLFQRLSDLDVAVAAHEASGMALRRAETLFADNGNASAQELENARSQERQDAARVALLERQLQTEWGGPLAGTDAKALAAALAAGRAAMVRIEIEVGTAPETEPLAASFWLPGVTAAVPLNTLWAAPAANPLRPGPAYIGLARMTRPLRPGMRGMVELTQSGGKTMGVNIPRAAVVYVEGEPWVYVVREGDRYDRLPIDLSMPLADGYFVDQTFMPGDRVVVAGAGLLLAEELGAAESED